MTARTLTAMKHETGGEANGMLVADLGREADGSEDCGERGGEDTELGHVRRELFAELGEVGASAAAAAATAAAAVRCIRCSYSSNRATAAARARLDEHSAVGSCTPNFWRLRRGRSRPPRPHFLIKHGFLPTYWDFESV